jgi:TonB-linked SusC/RagA family outer membrane protein
MDSNSCKHIFLLLVFSFLFCKVFSQIDSTIVTGVISDASTDEPLEGVKILAPGISSAFTNDSGKFTIQIPNLNITVQISRIGYQAKEVPLKGRSYISVKLYDESFESVYDLIKLPYSEQPFNTIMNSVDMINGSFSETSISPDGIIKGKISGLNVISRSGSPGIGSNMFLRGFSSIYATNQPLVIVDGMIFDIREYSNSMILGNIYNPLANIDVKDIESITLIKDGNSIYGSKAANGIILVNTMHAKEAVTRIDFYTHAGIKFIPEYIPVMDAISYRIYLTDQLNSMGLSPDEIQQLPYMIDDNTMPDYNRYHNNTNWQDEVFNQGFEQNYYLRVTGGDEIAKYGLSVGYLNSSGIIKETNFSRYSTRFNADVFITSRFKANTSIAFTYGEHNLRDDGTIPRTSPLYLSLIKAPVFAPYIINDLGQTTPTLEGVDSLDLGNPVSIIKNMTGDVQNYRFFGSIGVNYDITKNIKFNTLFGVNFDKKRENIFIPQLGVVPDSMENDVANNTSKSILDRLYSLYNDTRLIYNSLLNPVHHFSAILGVRYNTNQTESDWGTAFNTPTDDIKDLGSGSELLRRTGGALGDWKWMSIYSNVEYRLLNKYFIFGNLSFDGSSRFGSKADGIDLFSHKFGVFPSIGSGWLISSENFMSSLNFIDLLKLRLCYGVTGNDDIGNYSDEKYYTSQRFIGVVGSIRGNIPNPYIQWETNKKINIGLDIALFNERLKISSDLYQNTTDDMLVLKPADIISGFDYFLTNEGSMMNSGYELSLEGRILNGNLKWDAGISVAHCKNEIKELPQENIYEIGNANIISREGSPAGLFYGYKTEGVFVSDEEAASSGLQNKLYTGDLISFRGGDIRFSDKDGNSIIDENDMQVIGDPNPDLTGMFGSNLSWRRLSLNMLFTFSYGNDIYNQLRSNLESMAGIENQTVTVQNRWKYNGQVTDVPRAEWGDPMGNARFSDRWIEDGSYLRLKTVTLTYDLPVKNNFIQNAMVYISGNNLFTITNYLGYDPEFSFSESSLAQGIDLGLTPQFKSVFFGIKIGL